MTSIRCHNCNEMGHKASQCPYAANTPAGPAGRTPQQGEQQTFNGKVTAVKEGFCFMESRPGERWCPLPSRPLLLGRAPLQYLVRAILPRPLSGALFLSSDCIRNMHGDAFLCV